MKLYIKEKVFTWGDKFCVKDALGNDRYTVEGEVFTLGNYVFYLILSETEKDLVLNTLTETLKK